ncbi:MAG: exopolysaccharide biosynthesis polyprenyl glycosylphosphotransferase, partial [Actinotalea sp.]|nr:exopolysaccharide biosynthesis polyprenyl glycosylphosphotransferase [Actinotalea sp.]
MSRTTVVRQLLRQRGAMDEQVLEAVLAKARRGEEFATAAVPLSTGRAPEWVRRHVLVLAGLDALAALAACLMTYLLGGTAAPVLLLVVPAIWVLTCFLGRAYEARFVGAGPDEYRRVADAGGRLMAASAVAVLALGISVPERRLLLVLPLATVLSVLLRVLARWQLRRGRARGRYLHRVLVVGRERSTAELVRMVGSDTRAGFVFVGACVDRSREGVVEGVPVVGTSRTIMDAIERTEADTVTVA